MAVATLYWTYLQLTTKVRDDLDLTEETFIDDTEMLAYANEAIDRCEQLVHTLYEDYFLTKANISLVNGTDEYPLPDGIYAHKIRRMMYINGSQVYKVTRIGDWKKFEAYALDRVNSNSNLYQYFLINSVVGAPRAIFTPIPRETVTDVITLWYIRQANRLAVDADILDIPEAAGYLIQYMKMRCLEKEQNPMLEKAVSDLAVEKALLESTLASMVPDAENNIEPDFSSYEEMS